MKLSEVALPFQLNEDGEATGSEPIELKEIAKFYPKKAREAILALGRKGRVLYKGEPLFSPTGGISVLYENAIDAGTEYLKNVELERSVPMDIEVDDEVWDSYEYESRVDDSQEVYLGYRAADDCLYIGYDVWLEENDFNDNWDKQFKKYLGEEFDHENEQHAKIFDKAWKYFINHGFSVLFKLTYAQNAQFKAHEELRSDHISDKAGMFYEGIYRTSAFKSMGLVDIRLD